MQVAQVTQVTSQVREIRSIQQQKANELYTALRAEEYGRLRAEYFAAQEEARMREFRAAQERLLARIAQRGAELNAALAKATQVSGI